MLHHRTFRPPENTALGFTKTQLATPAGVQALQFEILRRAQRSSGETISWVASAHEMSAERLFEIALQWQSRR